jgi:hypothetical protein
VSVARRACESEFLTGNSYDGPLPNRQDGPRSLGTAYAYAFGMNGAEGLTGSCEACGTPLEHAVVREVRHFEETRLLEVTCARCARQFLAIEVEAPTAALRVEDVAAAAEQLAWARSLADLFAPGDLDVPDAA